MEQKQPISTIIVAIIMAAVMIVYSLVLNFLDLNQNQGLQWFSYLIILGLLILFINLYGKANNYNKSFGQLFGYGFRTTCLFTLIMVLFLIIFFSVFPEYKDKIVSLTREAMEKQEKLKEEQIDSFIETYNKRFLLIVVGGALLLYIILGCIGSLIGAAITKKNPHNPLEQLSV